jgi:hypothetical protein
MDAVFTFLGVATGRVTEIPRSNMSGWADETPLNTALRRTIRAGAAVGAHLPPQLWRTAQRPLVRMLRNPDSHRPKLSADQRRQLVDLFRDDIDQFEQLLGESFQDWLTDVDRGTYAVRSS